MHEAHVAILGAGPIGLEAALAAVEAGLSFAVYEATREVGGNVRAWGHVRMFTPWSTNVSPRSRCHLADAGLPVPSGEDCPTGDELVQRLLSPVAALPRVAPHLRLGERVVEVAREALLKHEEIGTGGRSGRPFRLLVETDGGAERLDRADVVLDCTGTYHNPNPLGEGGIHAIGERSMENRIVRRIPDVGLDPEPWTGRRVLLVGAGHSAQTAARDLADLAAGRTDTSIVWAMRRAVADFGVLPDDPLPRRAALAAEATRLVQDPRSPVSVRLGVGVERLAPAGDAVAVTLRALSGSETETEVVDRIVSLTGSVGEHRIYRQLQVHECWATQGPMKLAAALLASGSEDCLDQEGHGGRTLANPEPEFFVLGSKSYGRNNTFLLRVGWEQVTDTFELIGAGRVLRAGGAR